MDLRGKFKNDTEALQYIRTDVLPRLNPYLTFCQDPASYDSGSPDQIIAARGSAFWMTGPQELRMCCPARISPAKWKQSRALLADLPLGAVVRGFWWRGGGMGIDESAGVAMGSRLGKITLVSDYISNLSVHSGVVATDLKQKPRPPAPKFNPNKVYLCFTMSDGDNLCTWRSYFRKYYNDPARGTFPARLGHGTGADRPRPRLGALVLRKRHPQRRVPLRRLRCRLHVPVFLGDIAQRSPRRLQLLSTAGRKST